MVSLITALDQVCCLAVLTLQVLCNLLQLQLAVMQFDKQDASSHSSSVTELLQQCEQQRDLDRGSLAYMKLHFNMLQLMMLLQSANYKEIQGDAKEQKGQKQQQQPQAPLVEQMDGLLQQLSDIQQRAAIAGQPQQQLQAYEWLPLPVVTATVQLLAALVDKNGGRTKPGQKRITDGEFTCSRIVDQLLVVTVHCCVHNRHMPQSASKLATMLEQGSDR